MKYVQNNICPMYRFDIRLVDDVIRRIVGEFSPEMIIVFGSVANGTYTETSDLDLLVVMHTNMCPFDRQAAVLKAVRDIDLAKDVFVLTPDEFAELSEDPWDFNSEIVRTGRVVYDSHDPRTGLLRL